MPILSCASFLSRELVFFNFHQAVRQVHDDLPQQLRQNELEPHGHRDEELHDVQHPVQQRFHGDNGLGPALGHGDALPVRRVPQLGVDEVKHDRAVVALEQRADEPHGVHQQHLVPRVQTHAQKPDAGIRAEPEKVVERALLV